MQTGGRPRAPGQRQGPVQKSIAVASVPTGSPAQLLPGTPRGLDGTCVHSAASGEGTWSSGNHTLYSTGQETHVWLQESTSCAFHGHSLHTHPWKDSVERRTIRASPVDVQESETHRGLSPHAQDSALSICM